MISSQVNLDEVYLGLELCDLQHDGILQFAIVNEGAAGDWGGRTERSISEFTILVHAAFPQVRRDVSAVKRDLNLWLLFVGILFGQELEAQIMMCHLVCLEEVFDVELAARNLFLIYGYPEMVVVLSSAVSRMVTAGDFNDAILHFDAHRVYFEVHRHGSFLCLER